jgi:creatinine amidohydrolase
MTAPTRYLTYLTWPEIAALDKEDGVVILPIGAVEQHGPHLPTLTDTLIVTHLLDAALERLPVDVHAWALPALNYGKSNEHIGFPGTISLSNATLNAVLHDIAASVAAAGFRRLALVNGHGGNVAVLEAAARDIRAATGLFCFCIQPSFLVEPPFPISDQERRLGFHAGEVETSLILAIAPDLVHMDRALAYYADFPDTGTPLFFFGPTMAAWLSRDWSENGVFGDATLGTAGKGVALIEATADRLAALLTAISRFELPDQAKGS